MYHSVEQRKRMKMIKSESTIQQEGLLCKLDITVEPQEVQRLIEKKYNSYRLNAKIKGYRPGKVPLQFITTTYGPALRLQLTEEMVPALEKEAYDKYHVTPIEAPERQCGIVEEGKAFTLNLSFETYPKIEAYDLTSLTVPVVEAVVEENDITAAIEALRQDCVSWVKVDRVAERGDTISCHCVMEATQEGVENVDKKIEIYLSEDMPAAVSDALIGCMNQDSITIDKKLYPKWHSTMQAAVGVDVTAYNHCVLSHIEVLEKQLQTFDATYWRSKGYNAEDEEGLRKEIKDELTLVANVLAEDANYDVLRPVVVGLVDCLLPSKMVHDELERLKQHENKENIDIDKLAQDNVKLSLILRDRMIKSNIELDAHRLHDYVKSQSPLSGQFRDYYAHLVSQNKQMMQMSAMTVIERQLLDDILAHVVKEVSHVPYSTLKAKETT